jgi:hypothetical protein
MATNLPGISTCVTDLKQGDWIVYNDQNQNQRVVETESKKNGVILVRADFGNGGEPCSIFFDENETVLAYSQK